MFELNVNAGKNNGHTEVFIKDYFFMYYSSFKGSSFKHRSEAQSLLSFITQDVTPVYAQTYSTLHPKYTAKQKKVCIVQGCI